MPRLLFFTFKTLNPAGKCSQLQKPYRSRQRFPTEAQAKHGTEGSRVTAGQGADLLEGPGWPGTMFSGC